MIIITIKPEDTDLVYMYLYRNDDGTFTKRAFIHFHESALKDFPNCGVRGIKITLNSDELGSVEEEFSTEKLKVFFDYFEKEYKDLQN